MKRLTITLYLTIVMILGSAGVSSCVTIRSGGVHRIASLYLSELQKARNLYVCFYPRKRAKSAAMEITGGVLLDGGNYQEMAFRTPLIRQNRRCRAIGENNSSENGVILYNRPIVEITWGMSV